MCSWPSPRRLRKQNKDFSVSMCVRPQKRPTTHPKDYIESFTKNFPDIKVVTYTLLFQQMMQMLPMAHVVLEFINAELRVCCRAAHAFWWGMM